MRVGIVVYDGFDELDAVGPYEVLKNAAAAGAPLEVRLVTLRECASVNASHGLAVASEGTLDEAFDWLVVSGGSWAARKDVGAWGEINRGDLPRALARRKQQGVAMASVCTGTMLLSAAGITRGRPATTHHVAIEALRGEGAHIVEARVVDDGDLITSGGVTSGIELALWFIERHFGKAMADGIARQMEYPYRTSVWRASSENPCVGP
jgi:transcriptional regulator GlxA family with amidase domain